MLDPMNRTALLLMCVLAMPVSAGDFRALDFGAPCGNIRALEEQLGSVVGSASPEQGIYTFLGTYLDRPVEIGYMCPKGAFESGSYIFLVSSSREATDLYSQIKDKLIYELGQPEYDFDSQKFRERMHQQGVSQSGENEYTCTWEDHRRRIHLSAYGPRDGRNWKTAISYASKQRIQQTN